VSRSITCNRPATVERGVDPGDHAEQGAAGVAVRQRVAEAAQQTLAVGREADAFDVAPAIGIAVLGRGLGVPGAVGLDAELIEVRGDGVADG
jgi:hypothetical protein